MRTLLALVILIAFSGGASAQDDKIIVIGEDGTVSELDLGGATPPAPALKKNAPAPAPAPAVKPATKPAKKPAAPKQAKKKETVPVKQKTQKKQNNQKKQPVVAAPETAPRPSAAPSLQRLGPNMTPDDAIRIAIDAGPPARSVNAYPVNYNGIHAYQVIFATDEGDRSVFIDRETGKIME